MGDYADMMLEGHCCASCGEYLDNADPLGIPEYCGGCSGSSQYVPEGYDANGGKIKKSKHYTPTNHNSKVRKKQLHHLQAFEDAIKFFNKQRFNPDLEIDTDRLQKISNRVIRLMNNMDIKKEKS